MNDSPDIKRWYTPREAARLNLITSPLRPYSLRANYTYILRLISSGQLKAKNHGRGSRPYYLVSADEIERYHQTINEVEVGGTKPNTASQG